MSEWTLQDLVNAQNHHWCETSLLPQAVLKQDFILKNSVLGTNLYPAKNEEIYDIVAYLIFHVILHYF